MKYFNTFLAILILIATNVQAQRRTTPMPNTLKPVTKVRNIDNGVQTNNNIGPSQNFLANLHDRTQETEIIVGNTYYDLQTNGGVRQRLAYAGNEWYADWTGSLEANTTYSDRGSFVSKSTSGIFPDPSAVNSRIESARSGFTNIANTTDGKVVVVSHVASGPLNFLSRDASASTWTQSTIPSTQTLLWPAMCVGGSNGKTIHVIATTTPVGSGGTIYNGIDGHLLYYRSQDGGTTWDKTDFIIPGCDSNYFKVITADSYTITAKGNTVVVGLFDNWNDCVIYKSTDNGNTWTSKTVLDFPLTKYAPDQGYTIADIPHPADQVDTDSLPIFTTDGAGALLIDNNNKVHVWFGRMWVTDNDLTDGNTSYYPATEGLCYWNEDHATGVFDTITYVMGYPQDSLTASTQIGLIYTSLTSHPSASVDATGRIILTYSGLDLRYYNSTQSQFYRHVYAMGSIDNGTTWYDPIDLNTPEICACDDGYKFYDSEYPSQYPTEVSNKRWMIYQWDNSPGLHVLGDADPAEINNITIIGIDPAPILHDDVKLVLNPDLKLTVSPNPVEEMISINYTLTKSANVKLVFTNMLGQIVKIEQVGGQPAGEINNMIHVRNLPSGVYNVTLVAGTESQSTKIVKL